MSLLRVNRRFIIGMLFLLFFVSLPAHAAEQWELWYRGEKAGDVAVRSTSSGMFVAIDQMLERLGIPGKSLSREFQAVKLGKKLELWHQSTVGRVAGAPVMFPSPILFDNGHYWGDQGAALRIVNQFLISLGEEGTAEWKRTAGKASVHPSYPVVVPAAPIVPVIGGKPASVLVREIRWGEQPGAYRVVIEFSGEPRVSLDRPSGKLVVVFPDGAFAPDMKRKEEGRPSDIQMGFVRRDEELILTFTHKATRVKTFSLNQPHRFVIDFEVSSENSVVSVPKTQPKPVPVITPTPSTADDSGRAGIVKADTKGKRPLVVLDAGHGGHDPGAVANGLREKDIALKATHQLMAQLQRRGVDVKLTRTGDTYLKLAERTALANKWNADLFVSLHCNALPPGRTARGIEIYFMAQPTDKDAMRLAILENKEISGNTSNDGVASEVSDKKTRLLLKILGDMQQNDKINESTVVSEILYRHVKRSGLNMRRVAQAPFFVLRGAAMPALLIEMGFLTDKSDAALLNSAPYREKLMNYFSLGIVEYLNQIRREGA